MSQPAPSTQVMEVSRAKEGPDHPILLDLLARLDEAILFWTRGLPVPYPSSIPHPLPPPSPSPVTPTTPPSKQEDPLLASPSASAHTTANDGGLPTPPPDPCLLPISVSINLPLPLPPRAFAEYDVSAAAPALSPLSLGPGPVPITPWWMSDEDQYGLLDPGEQVRLETAAMAARLRRSCSQLSVHRGDHHHHHRPVAAGSPSDLLAANAPRALSPPSLRSTPTRLPRPRTKPQPHRAASASASGRASAVSDGGLVESWQPFEGWWAPREREERASVPVLSGGRDIVLHSLARHSAEQYDLVDSAAAAAAAAGAGAGAEAAPAATAAETRSATEKEWFTRAKARGRQLVGKSRFGSVT